MVSSMRDWYSSGSGSSWCEGTQVVEKVSSSPAFSVNSSACLPSTAFGSRGPRRISRSGPATAVITWLPCMSWRRTQGRILP